MRGPFLPQRPSRARTRPDQRGSTAAAGAAGAGFAAALWYWATEACSKPLELWCGEGDLKSKVLPLCSCLLQPFRPSPWALNNHVQNIFGFLRTATIRNDYRRQLVIAHDGGTLALDWWSGCDSHAYGTATTPVLLVLHGINGGSQEGYCKWMCEAARSRGWRAVVLNYRGCSGLPLTSPRGYAATLTHDVHYAITSIKARFPAAPLFAVGYSLGGVFLTKYLSEADRGLHASLAAASSAFKPFEGSGLVATAVVSTPVCLFNSSQNLSKPWTAGYLYNMALAYKLREFMVEHRAAITAHTSLNVDKAMQHWEMGAIEDEGIPHTFGFSNRQEYYEASNSLQYIPFIRTPTLFLVSKDDPFLGVLPDEECSANPHTLLAATARGGHVAFLEGLWPLGPAFMDRAVLQFLEVAWSQLPAAAQAAMQLPPELLPPEAQAVGLGVGHGAGASHEEAAGEGGEAHGMSKSGRAAAWLHTENPYVVSQFKLPPLPRWEGAYQQQQELQQQQQQQACEQQQQQQLGPDQQGEGTDRGEPHVPLTGLGACEAVPASVPAATSVPAAARPEQQATGAAADSWSCGSPAGAHHAGPGEVSKLGRQASGPPTEPPGHLLQPPPPGPLPLFRPPASAAAPGPDQQRSSWPEPDSQVGAERGVQVAHPFGQPGRTVVRGLELAAAPSHGPPSGAAHTIHDKPVCGDHGGDGGDGGGGDAGGGDGGGDNGVVGHSASGKQLGESSPTYGTLPSPAQAEVLVASLAAGSRSADEGEAAHVGSLTAGHMAVTGPPGHADGGAALSQHDRAMRTGQGQVAGARSKL